MLGEIGRSSGWDYLPHMLLMEGGEDMMVIFTLILVFLFVSRLSLLLT